MSAIYHNPAKVELHHAALAVNEGKKDCYKFVQARHNQITLPYKFILHDGEFSEKSRYATLLLYKSSYVAAVRLEWYGELRYMRLTFYWIKAPNIAKMQIMILANSKSLIKVSIGIN